jgi:DNA-binding IscR family transcriptional regulator
MELKVVQTPTEESRPRHVCGVKVSWNAVSNQLAQVTGSNNITDLITKSLCLEQSPRGFFYRGADLCVFHL